MNYYQYFLDSKGNRDSVFNYTLDLFQKKSINILEIGAARDLNPNSRMGDGWSTLHFVKYLSENGGKIDICDISIQSLDNTKLLLASGPSVDYTLHLSTGLERLKSNNNYDLIFLDGGDNPNEMIEEFNLIDKSKSKILCDDFHTKGQGLRDLNSNFILFKWPGNNHEMALYTEKHQVINLEPIQ